MFSGTAWLIVLPNLSLGGAQRQALLLADYLQQRGARVILVLTDVNYAGRAAYFQAGHIRTFVARQHCRPHLKIALLIALMGVPAGWLRRALFKGDLGHRLELTLSSMRAWIVKRFLWRSDSPESTPENAFIRNFPGAIFAADGLRKLVRKESPDIVLSFLPKTNLITILGLQSERVGRPVIAVCERNDVCRQVLVRGVQRGREELYELADFVFANSRHAVDDLNKMSKKLNARWMPNLSLPDVAGGASSANSRVIAVVGRLAPSKRVDKAIEAFSKSGLPGAGWRMRIVGEGPERGQLTSLVSKLDLTDAVDFVAPMEDWRRDSPPPAALILASDREGFPNVFAEALSVSILPLVRYSVEEVGFVFGAQLFNELGFSDVNDLADLLNRLASQPQWREKQLAAAAAAFSGYQMLAQESFGSVLESMLDWIPRLGQPYKAPGHGFSTS